MNVHKRCEKHDAALCGIDHTERRGRINIKLTVKDGNKLLLEGINCLSDCLFACLSA